MTADLDVLAQVATGKQADHVAAIQKHGSQAKAAEALGINRRTIERSLEACRKKAALRGYAPEHDLTHPVAEGQTLKGASTLYDADGQVVMQWVKSQADKEKLEALLREVAQAMSDEIKREKPIPKPKTTQADLLNCYVITDFHLGMRAWHEETGGDWDAKIAEDLLVDWFRAAIDMSPNAQTGLLAQLGDMLHYDSLEAVTPQGKYVLDADTRFSKLVRIVIRALRRVVKMLLEKHDQLHIIMAEGNHDPASSVWLREWFAALYEDEPRVSVDQSPAPYYAYEHGQTLIGFHHGHKRDIKRVDEVIASTFREEYGRTKHCYTHIGHLHDSAVYESNLMIVERHRTLASPDAYAARGGWRSGRSASVITYHNQHGEVGRVVVSPEMCASASKPAPRP